MEKPINSTSHAVLDYAMAGMHLVMPSLLGFKKKSRRAYKNLGLAMLGVNSVTDTPMGMAKVISFKDHQKADAGMLAGMAMLTFSKAFKKDKKALVYHLIVLALAGGQYLMTDFDSRS